MSFNFVDNGASTGQMEERNTVFGRTMATGNAVAEMIKNNQEYNPDYLIIDLDKYDDGKESYAVVKKNVIASLEESFRGRITATKNYRPDWLCDNVAAALKEDFRVRISATNYIDSSWIRENGPVWTEVKQGDGCDYRYVKIVFIKQ